MWTEIKQKSTKCVAKYISVALNILRQPTQITAVWGSHNDFVCVGKKEQQEETIEYFAVGNVGIVAGCRLNAP